MADQPGEFLEMEKISDLHSEDQALPNAFSGEECSRPDFVLTYKIENEGEAEKKRKAFYQNLKKKGVKAKDSMQGTVTIHSSYNALKKGAEELSLHMPINCQEKPHLCPKQVPWYKDLFRLDRNRKSPISEEEDSLFHYACPRVESWSKIFFQKFNPKVPKREYHLKAPYKRECGQLFKNHDKEAEFFSRAQRSYITKFILETTHYEDEIKDGEEGEFGITSMIDEKYFKAAFPLHDGPYKTEQDLRIYDMNEEAQRHQIDNTTDKVDDDNKRQLLHREWSHPRNWYKYQPIEEIRDYFGERIGLYFVWIGFYTSWLLIPSIVGIIITLCGLYTLSTQFNPIAREICDEDNRQFFYMCPLCDETCDFWYYRSSCVFAHLSLVFDYGGTVFFAAFIALWAVVFLEFWKRKEARLQYQWNIQWYEIAEERETPYFVSKIHKKLKKVKESDKKFYIIPNEIVGRIEYYQPRFYLWPKIYFAFSILLTIILMVVGIFLAIIIYRLAVLGPIYAIARHLIGGPSAASFISSVTGSVIQLLAIIVMNVVYEFAADKLTRWELHRTKTAFNNSFTFKMYLFHFVNYYTSLFYVAFFRGSFSGHPGEYNYIGPFRINECPAYGCLMELTIQLVVIFTGKQILNDILELRSFIYRKLKDCVLCRKAGKEDLEQDVFLLKVKEHHLFNEYLELVVQYGFVTMFVAAFPLAPFFAWLNNVVEIRLDAFKLVRMYRRPVAERTQNIGAWFYILRFVTVFCVVINALIIAFTSSFIDREVYERLYGNQLPEDCNSAATNNATDCTQLGIVAWSTSPVNLSVLLEPREGADMETSFPFLEILKVPLYIDGVEVEREASVGENAGDIEPILYQPFLNFTCLAENLMFDYELLNFTESEFRHYYMQADFQNLTLRSVDGNEDGHILSGSGICFLNETKCRVRGQFDSNGEHPLKYWRTLAIKLSFVILFENIIFMIGVCIDFLIPDTPPSVKKEIRREKFLTAKALIGTEKQPLEVDEEVRQS